MSEKDEEKEEEFVFLRKKDLINTSLKTHH